MLMRAAMGAVKYVMVFQRPAKVKHHWAMGAVYMEHRAPEVMYRYGPAARGPDDLMSKT